MDSGNGDVMVRWQIDDDGAALAVRHGNRDVTRYVYRPSDARVESPRPYLHPVRSLNGIATTAYRPDDHVWHKGVSLALPVVGRHNLWGGPTYIRDVGYQQVDNNGTQEHLDFSGAFAEEAGAGISQDLRWVAQGGREIAVERRELAFASLPPQSPVPGWVLTWSTAVRNVSGEALDLGSPTTKGRENAGYGGFFWRGAAGFLGGSIAMADWNGGDEARGRRGRWATYNGPLDGPDVAITIVGSADNPCGLDSTPGENSEPEWFIRTEEYPALNPAPFFSREVAFGPGEELFFDYALAVTDARLDATDAAAVARVAAEFLTADPT